jgi:thiosulfate/3-mercaptopyruvate sulfurtransferase
VESCEAPQSTSCHFELSCLATVIATYYRPPVRTWLGELLPYCGGGISATANALALSSIGMQHFRVYDGSLEEWSADPNLPLVVS